VHFGDLETTSTLSIVAGCRKEVPQGYLGVMFQLLPLGVLQPDRVEKLATRVVGPYIVAVEGLEYRGLGISKLAERY